MPWCMGNFHTYKELDFLRLNDFIQQLDINFHSSVINTENSALNIFAEHDYINLINMKRPSTGLRLNTLL